MPKNYEFHEFSEGTPEGSTGERTVNFTSQQITDLQRELVNAAAWGDHQEVDRLTSLGVTLPVSLSSAGTSPSVTAPNETGSKATQTSKEDVDNAAWESNK
ncbi:MAG TPA: hypothetical protein VFN56_02285 [Candidatus Saccharimonadales bacterium]|nr:hypothetical protein [Candidatus Saccharimonadales bacterium]